MLRRAAFPCKVHRRVDQTTVQERLREVAHQAPRRYIVLLGKRADVVAQAQQSFEDFLGFLFAS